MTLATSLRGAARTLIDTFGNTGDLYTYTSATVVENEEGDMTVSDWGSSNEIKIVDGDNVTQELVQATQGMEILGEDDKIVRDDVTIVVDDRLTAESINYRVVEVRPIRTQDTLVVQLIKVARVDIITQW